jgi:hypothetical protein
LRFQRVSYQEITPVDEGSLDLLRSTAFDREVLRGVVAVVALLLGMTRLAQLAVFGGELAVVARKFGVVPQERAWRSARQITRRMTRGARSHLPFCLVLMARKATRHWWKWRTAGLDHPGVTRHALALDLLHCQVPGVVEADRVVRGLWFCQHLCDARNIRAMTGHAKRHFRSRSGGLGYCVATTAGEAGGLAGLAASEPREMHQVGERGRGVLRASRDRRGNEHRDQERERELGALHRKCPRPERSKA